MFIVPGDTLIVEEEKNKPKPQSQTTVTKGPSLDLSPVLERHVVPADNSCLFTSVNYVMEGGVYDPGCAPEMRGLIAQIVASDPTGYSEAVLGKTNEDYCSWIRRDDTWGGAIEVSILSKFYQSEICVVDTQTVRVDRFGEDAGYTKRVLLIYDGIHYDPLQKVMPNSDIPAHTVFSTTDDIILAQALELADEARRKRQYTDVNRFALRCMVCQTGLVGQKEAREHAKETGHTNFGEVWRSSLCIFKSPPPLPHHCHTTWHGTCSFSAACSSGTVLYLTFSSGFRRLPHVEFPQEFSILLTLVYSRGWSIKCARVFESVARCDDKAVSSNQILKGFSTDYLIYNDYNTSIRVNFTKHIQVIFHCRIKGKKSQ